MMPEGAFHQAVVLRVLSDLMCSDVVSIIKEYLQ